MSEWHNFFAAMSGASATLTGLIFVGISINLTKLLSMPSLPDRGLESLILLLNILIISALSLLPGETPRLLGIEYLFIGGSAWFFMIFLDIRIWRHTPHEYKGHAAQNAIFSQLAILPYIAAGIMLLMNGFSGIYWLIPGVAISFIKAIIDAWVLLVEIHR